MLVSLVKDAFIFSLYLFDFFDINQVYIVVWFNVKDFDLTPLVHVSVFMPIPSCFNYNNSIIEFKVRDSDASV